MSGTPPGTTDELRVAADALGRIAMAHYHDFKQFRRIYYSSAEQIDLLNAVAPGFFADLHRWLLDRIALNVRKILDPAATGKKSNLTVPAIHAACLSRPKFPATEAEVLLVELKDLATHVEPWRHHLVAHIDHEAALGRSKAVYTVIPSDVEAFYSTLDRYFALMYRSLWNDLLPLDAVQTSDASELLLACRHGAVMSELFDRDFDTYDALMTASRFSNE